MAFMHASKFEMSLLNITSLKLLTQHDHHVLSPEAERKPPQQQGREFMRW